LRFKSACFQGARKSNIKSVRAITPDVVARHPAPLYDPFMRLGWLAELTRRVELGSTVIILR
jgi:alkanesulfonate monooxygenase SsuD/methylene tetrahydromethanopterin reductase-like flavin-dependent oxidoreductase (luciferase family)